MIKPGPTPFFETPYGYDLKKVMTKIYPKESELLSQFLHTPLHQTLPSPENGQAVIYLENFMKGENEDVICKRPLHRF